MNLRCPKCLAENAIHVIEPEVNIRYSANNDRPTWWARGDEILDYTENGIEKLVYAQCSSCEACFDLKEGREIEDPVPVIRKYASLALKEMLGEPIEQKVTKQSGDELADNDPELLP